jgi:hypothetical protein
MNQRKRCGKNWKEKQLCEVGRKEKEDKVKRGRKYGEKIYMKGK